MKMGLMGHFVAPLRDDFWVVAGQIEDMVGALYRMIFLSRHAFAGQP